MKNDFELVTQITGIEVIAVNLSIRELQSLKDLFGGRRWRKLKQVARTFDQRQPPRCRTPLVRGSRRWPPQDEDQAISGLSFHGQEAKAVAIEVRGTREFRGRRRPLRRRDRYH